jgi:hypothetical protein
MGEQGEGAATAITHVERRVERDHVLLSEGRGQVRVECPAAAVVLVRVISGPFTEPLARAYTTEVEGVIASVGAIDLFVDAQSSVDVVDPKARPYMMGWTNRWRGSLRSVHMFAPGSNKVVSMVLTVANLLTGGSMQLHTSRAAFDAALRHAVRGS